MIAFYIRNLPKNIVSKILSILFESLNYLYRTLSCQLASESEICHFGPLMKLKYYYKLVLTYTKVLYNLSSINT